MRFLPVLLTFVVGAESLGFGMLGLGGCGCAENAPGLRYQVLWSGWCCHRSSLPTQQHVARSPSQRQKGVAVVTATTRVLRHQQHSDTGGVAPLSATPQLLLQLHLRAPESSGRSLKARTIQRCNQNVSPLA
ncbi:hypothetical protein Y032_0036g3324 [Ancylostoma ceylanicum]|nr:hypothetical protein Y032_0036g3324 [Ancylostoma ceylanicum]